MHINPYELIYGLSPEKREFRYLCGETMKDIVNSRDVNEVVTTRILNRVNGKFTAEGEVVAFVDGVRVTAGVDKDQIHNLLVIYKPKENMLFCPACKKIFQKNGGLVFTLDAWNTASGDKIS